MKSPDLGVRVEVRGDGDGALDGGDGAGARPAPLQLSHHRRQPQLKATKSELRDDRNELSNTNLIKKTFRPTETEDSTISYHLQQILQQKRILTIRVSRSSISRRFSCIISSHLKVQI